MDYYYPASTVLEEYTDDALREQRFYKGAAAELLLTIPAAYRQPCEVEINNRTRPAGAAYDGRTLKQDVNVDAIRRKVVGEILAQLALHDA